MNEARNLFKSTELCWASSMQMMKRNQKIMATKLINDCLYVGLRRSIINDVAPENKVSVTDSESAK